MNEQEKLKATENLFRNLANQCAALEIKLPQHQAIQNGIQGLYNALQALENPKVEEVKTAVTPTVEAKEETK